MFIGLMIVLKKGKCGRKLYPKKEFREGIFVSADHPVSINSLNGLCHWLIKLIFFITCDYESVSGLDLGWESQIIFKPRFGFWLNRCLANIKLGSFDGLFSYPLNEPKIVQFWHLIQWWGIASYRVWCFSCLCYESLFQVFIYFGESKWSCKGNSILHES